MTDEPRYDIYTDAGPVRQEFLWPIAENQPPIEAFKWNTLLRTQFWQVELRSTGKDMETWAKERAIQAVVTAVNQKQERKDMSDDGNRHEPGGRGR